LPIFIEPAATLDVSPVNNMIVINECRGKVLVSMAAIYVFRYKVSSNMLMALVWLICVKNNPRQPILVRLV
jgi:hypothetical protein